VAVALLAANGYSVAAVTGRPEAADYLRGLGAARIVPRADLAETTPKPLESETWAGCIDNVGGAMLARVLGQMRANASVAAVGLAGGAEVPMKITPFLLRGVNLLGIHSVTVPRVQRVMAWDRIAAQLPMAKLEAMVQDCGLADLPALGQAILAGRVQGRIVVDVRR
jgi:acrylyl-CoA reductase (NADPH)